MTAAPFAEFAILLLLAAAAGALFVRLRQPVLIAYIVVGIALGPAGLGWVKAHDQVALLAQIGVTVLLFIVGLKLDLHHVRHIGPVALATGLGQLAFTIAGGFVLTLPLVSSTRALVHALRGAGYAGPIAVTARDEAALQELQRLDVQHIYLPFRDAAVHAAEHLVGVLTVPPASGANP